MSCPQDSVLEYSAGRLAGPERAAVEAHLQDCAHCEELVARQAALWSALDEWEPAPVSPDFNRRLWQKIDSAASAPWHRRLIDSLRMGAWKPAVPLAAAAAFVVAGFMYDHRAPVTPVGSAAVSSVEAEQAERALDDLQLLKQLDPATRPM